MRLIRGILSGEFSTNKNDTGRIILWVLEIENLYDGSLCKEILELFLSSDLSYFSLILFDKLFAAKKVIFKLKR